MHILSTYNMLFNIAKWFFRQFLLYLLNAKLLISAFFHCLKRLLYQPLVLKYVFPIYTHRFNTIVDWSHCQSYNKWLHSSQPPRLATTGHLGLIKFVRMEIRLYFVTYTIHITFDGCLNQVANMIIDIFIKADGRHRVTDINYANVYPETTYIRNLQLLDIDMEFIQRLVNIW